MPPPVLIFLESNNNLNLDPPYVRHSWTGAADNISLSVIKNLKGFSKTGLDIRQNKCAGPAKVKFLSIYGLYMMISSNQHVPHVHVVGDNYSDSWQAQLHNYHYITELH